MSIDHRDAWSDFWAQRSRSAQGGGCLPDGWRGIDEAQRQAWRKFARLLPRNARVLDLATGDARVLRRLGEVRPDLRLEGVDLAPELPPPPKGIRIYCGVAMENLPLPTGQYEVVVSQFGFEYGDPTATAREARRILGKDGLIGLLTHRRDGPILAHNLDRRDAIRWAIEECDLPGVAKRALALRSAGISALPPAIAEAPAAGADRFGPQSAAWEIAEAIRQTLAVSVHERPERVAAAIDAIVDMARNEQSRIASLEAACAATASEEEFRSALEAAGLEQVSIEPVGEAERQPPFADFRTIRPA